mgnify:CR=1 FL=1
MSVRWDAVVKNNTFWSSRRVTYATAAVPDAAGAGAPVEVQVWMFGRLAGPEVTNPLMLRFAGDAHFATSSTSLGAESDPISCVRLSAKAGSHSIPAACSWAGSPPGIW